MSSVIRRRAQRAWYDIQREGTTLAQALVAERRPDMPGSFQIGKIAGINIQVNVSWLVILVLLTFSLAVSWFPATVPRQSTVIYWALGFIAALLLFVSVLLHELAHSLVARARGLPVKSTKRRAPRPYTSDAGPTVPAPPRACSGDM